MGLSKWVRQTEIKRVWKEHFGLYKTKVIRRDRPWRNLGEVEFATLEWVDWFNNRRLLGPIGNIPPVEFEVMYNQCQRAPVMVAGVM